MIPDLHAIAQLAALHFIDSLLEGACIAAFAALVLYVMRRQSSGMRFAFCFSALLAIALLPFLHIYPRASAEEGHAAIALPESWALYFFAAWGLIACFGLLRLARALHHLHRTRKDCVPVDLQSLDPLLPTTLATHKVNRRFTLCTAGRVRIPTAIGLLNPVIVIPRWVMQELSPAELNQILLHELAHLRRWDDWTNLAQQIIKALFFFHPAVWWIEKRIALEREMACDDAVLAASPSPRSYAECLARLAEKSFVRQSIALAQAALGKIRQTSQRVAQILSVDRPANHTRNWKPAAGLVVGFAVACGVVVSRTPELVTFRNSQPAQVASALQSLPVEQEHLNLAHPAVFMASSQRRQPAGLIPAKLKVRSQQQNQQTHPLNLNEAARPPLTRSVRLTSSHPNVVPFTETLFFVVDDTTGTSGQQVFRIQLLRVIVFHPADGSTAQAPAKQT